MATLPVVQEPVNLFSRPFADQGLKTIPPDDNAGTDGRASLTQGFPPITQVKPEAGGLPPQRADFNGMYYMLSAFCYWLQSGGQWQYKQTLRYAPNCMVLQDKKFFMCLRENGVDTIAGVKVPGTQGSETYWQDILPFIGGITSDEAQKQIDTSIGEIPKPTSTHFGAYQTVGTSGTVVTDGIITALSNRNQTITGYVNGLIVMQTAGRSKYGQGSTSISFPVPKGASYFIDGCQWARWLPLISD
jgi:hypothetical protein